MTVDVATNRTSCGEPCRGASCSVSFRIGEQPITCVDILVPCGPIFFPFNSKPPCVPPEEAIRGMKSCPGGRVITDESPAPAIERRPPRRTPRGGTRRPEPVSESEDDDSDDRDEETGDGASNTPTTRRATPVSGTQPGRTHAPATAPATVIRSVRTSVMGGVLRIYIDTDGAAEFNSFTLAGPSRIVVDVRGVSNPYDNKIIPTDSRFVERVRVGQPDPATVRVVLDLTGQVPYEVIREGSSIVIVVGERGPTAKTGSR